MLRLTPALLALVFALGAAPAQSRESDAWRLSPEGRAAYEALLDAPLFAVGGVGYGAETSEGEEALGTLLDEAGARAALESLVTRATREGGLYALLGLRVLGSDTFAAEARRFRERPDGVRPRRKTGDLTDLLKDDPALVRTASGCVFQAESWEGVLRRVEAGHYDLRLRERAARRSGPN